MGEICQCDVIKKKYLPCPYCRENKPEPLKGKELLKFNGHWKKVEDIRSAVEWFLEEIFNEVNPPTLIIRLKIAEAFEDVM